MNRVTPENIKELKPGEIFVFGSNLSGKHGKGAAKTALKFGAVRGKAFGEYGRTYALPTKGYDLKVLPLETIEKNIQFFERHVFYSCSTKVFLVTAIGCGLAGYKPEQIAPMFKWVNNFTNVYLPQSFWDILEVRI